MANNKQTKLDKVSTYKTIGYWSCLGGVELKHIEHGIEDKATIIVNAWNGQKSVHTVKIYYNTDDTYIIVCGQRLKFSECIRV